jgi:thiamine pyrophosphate-dependent acetolactate synthase large subunit-like protein
MLTKILKIRRPIMAKKTDAEKLAEMMVEFDDLKRLYKEAISDHKTEIENLGLTLEEANKRIVELEKELKNLGIFKDILDQETARMEAMTAFIVKHKRKFVMGATALGLAVGAAIAAAVADSNRSDEDDE